MSFKAKLYKLCTVKSTKSWSDKLMWSTYFKYFYVLVSRRCMRFQRHYLACAVIRDIVPYAILVVCAFKKILSSVIYATPIVAWLIPFVIIASTQILSQRYDLDPNDFSWLGCVLSVISFCTTFLIALRIANTGNTQLWDMRITEI